MSKFGVRFRHVFVILAVIGMGACAGNGCAGCSCVTPIKGGFPVDKRHENAIQVRASAGLFDFVGKNGPSLLSGILGGNTVNVPPQCGGSTPVCCAKPNQVCPISLDVKDVALTPTSPNQLALNTHINLKTVDPLPVSIPVLGNCTVSLDTSKTAPANVQATLAFTVDKVTNTTALSVPSAPTVDIDAGAISLGGDVLCIATNLPGLHDLVVGILKSAVAGQLQTLVGGVACAKCTTKDDCNSFATACTNGQCIESDNKTCVPSLGIEGKIDFGSLLASVAPGLHAFTDLLVVAGGYASADTGLSLGMLGGALGDPHNGCVPVVPPPDAPPVAQSKTFQADTLPDGKTAFHLGVGIHKTELDTIGWGVFDAGLLCLHVGTPAVPQLSSKTIGIVIQSLQDLVHSNNAPMYLALKPTRPPTFTLGKGTFKMDASGATVIDDPLLNVSIPGLSIDFYAFADDRYVRIMTLTTDLLLPLGLQVDAMGGINPVFGDLTKAFTNVTVTNSELLAESPASLAQVFPMLLAVAIGQVAANLKSIALPAVLGLQPTPVAITSSDANADGVNQFLALFLNLAPAKMPFQPARVQRMETRASVDHVTVPPTREFAVDKRGSMRPTATLRVDGDGGNALEYSWALDDGTWSAFSQGPLLTVDDPRLWLQGHHTVDVRARLIGQPDSADATPARVDVIIDSIAPSGGFDVAGRELAVDASDNVSEPEALVYRVAVGGGAFGDWTSGSRLTVPSGASADVLRVEARDEAGNVGELGFHGRSTAPSASGCSCEVGARGGETRLPALVAILGLVGWLARRRRGLGRLALLVAAGGIVSVAGACNSPHTLGKGDLEDPRDEVGRFLDTAVRGNTLHLSAYDSTYGDLVYATVTDAKVDPTWQLVDGVDPTAVADTKDGYRHGVSDPGPDVGMFTSIAISTSGDPYIAYYDNSNHALKLAIGPSPFKVVTVDSSSGGSDVGRYAALSLDAHNVPTIAYVASHIASGSGFKSELRVAVASGDRPSAGQFTITPVDSTPISCAGACATGSACVMPAMVNGMANNDPSTSTCQTVDTAPCSATCSATQACVQNVCTNVVAAPGAPDLVEGTGLFVNARRTKAGTLILVYYDREQGDLKMATGAGSNWSVSFIDGQDPTTDVGQFATVALGSDDSVHVAYVDAINDRLLYKHVAGGSVPMTPDVIDDGMRGTDKHSVGGGANLILDSAGHPRVVYQDQQLSDLELATNSGSWSHSDLMQGPAGYGFYPRQILSGGQLFFAELVYDRANAVALGKVQISITAP